MVNEHRQNVPVDL